ncbi:hypothetical protein IDG49_02655 [Pelagibacterales bacterium SAG-MED07]|nr:hypothetical protein [Pelagibacterales bacterium SAG-MED07]
MTNDNYNYSTLRNIVKDAPKYFYEKYLENQKKSFQFLNKGGLRTQGKFKISKKR